jgi:cell division protein FtsW
MSAPRDAGRAQHAVDPWLFGAAGALLLLGLVMVASASMTIADKLHHDPFHFVERQAVFALVGLLAAIVALQVPLKAWEAMAPALLATAFALLTVVLVPGIGREVNGSTRWIALGPLRLQPSELARLCFVLWLAAYLVKHAAEVRGGFKGFAKPLVVLGGAAGLLLLEPDFGATVVLAATMFAMLFVGGVRLRDFALVLLAAVAALVGIALLQPYRVARLTAFMDPWADPFDTGFQLTQSLIAIGSGQLTGVGLGQSVQKLFYLPEAHNDFVFAVLAEELGFVGVLAVVLLFGVLVWRGLAIARAAAHAGHGFGSYLALGLTCWLGLQAFVNAGVTMGLLPTKGLTLPLLSAGGSSLIVACAAIGLIGRVHRETCAGGDALWARKRAAAEGAA